MRSNMRGLFAGARAFNQGSTSNGTHSGDINTWDTSKVTDMYMMFGVPAHAFNRYIGDWDVSKCYKHGWNV